MYTLREHCTVFKLAHFVCFVCLFVCEQCELCTFAVAVVVVDIINCDSYLTVKIVHGFPLFAQIDINFRHSRYGKIINFYGENNFFSCAVLPHSLRLAECRW